MAVVAANVSRIYGAGEASVKALDRVNLEIAGGTLVAVMGLSGSGKSTTMRVLGSLSGTSKPARQCTRVDFPDPEGPITATRVPPAISRFTRSSALTEASPAP